MFSMKYILCDMQTIPHEKIERKPFIKRLTRNIPKMFQIAARARFDLSWKNHETERQTDKPTDQQRWK